MIGAYNVSGPLTVAYQDTFTAHLSGCDISEYATNSTSAGEVIYEQIYNASIAMVLRGNCTFSEKVYNAQLLGAVGVIVGDEKDVILICCCKQQKSILCLPISLYRGLFQ